MQTFLKNIKEKFMKLWKDQVWSKVIAFLIIGFLSVLYSFVYSLISFKKFRTSLSEFWAVDFPLWAICLIALIFLLFILLSKYFNKNKEIPYKYDADTLKLDKELFDEIRNNLLPQSEIIWLSTHNFAGYSFDMSHFEPYQKILVQSQKADFEFLNPNLEINKNELISMIKDFNLFVTPNVFNAGNMRLTVPSEWELDSPERFNIAVNGIHTRTQQLSNKYTEFIKKGRRILKV
jgi:hypothetical protein